MKTVARCDQLSRLWVPLVLIATGFAQSSPASSPATSDESRPPIYHSAASEVRIAFIARDEHNHTVQDLRKDDIAVVDNDRVIRAFRSFSRSTSIKLDVIVLFDSSESVQPHFKQEMAEVLELVSQWPWNTEDEVSVLSFSGTEVRPVCAGDCRSSLTADRIASLPRGGSTPLFDALDTATKLLGKRRAADVWPVIILFSDGDDTISKASLSSAIEKTLASEAQVYAIDLGDPSQPSNGTATLQKVADESGGRRMRINEGAVRIFTDIIDDLRSAWVVTYALPPSSSDLHSIRILPTHNLNLQFRSRRRYYRNSSSAD